MTISFRALWQKLARSKKYREHFVEAQVKRGIPAQIRALMKQQELTQTELAKRAGLTQGVVSRAASPSYGNLTLNTVVRIAAGLDVAFIGRFVPFTDLTAWFDNVGHETSIIVTPFETEDERYREAAATTTEADSTSRSAKLFRIPRQPVKMTLNDEGTSRNAEYAI